MSWNSKKSNKVTNIILGLICIALVVILGGLLVTNHKEVKQESERLQKLSDSQETGIDDYESVKEHVSELEQEAGEENAETSDSSKNAQQPSKEIQSAADAQETSKEEKATDSEKSSESENTDKSNTESRDSEKK